MSDLPLPVRRPRRAIRMSAKATGYTPPDWDKPVDYISSVLGWQPWHGTSELPGQCEVLDAYVAALRTQIENPNAPVKNWLRIEAGHTVGKTKLAAGIVSHFFDAFPDAIIYCFAPNHDQVNDLLFKELRIDREGRKDLPGRVLATPEITHTGGHFVKGRAFNNSKGKGSERIHGQHAPHQLFVLDEAEGLDDGVFSSVRSMASGGISIVLMLANPRTRTSTFHKMATRPEVQNFRISCLSHPNVVQGQEVVPGAVKRSYVESMLAAECEVVTEHSDEHMTFEVPWEPGTIYKPTSEFMWRVLGVAPRNISDKTVVPIGIYEGAVLRGVGIPPLETYLKRTTKAQRAEERGAFAALGLDVARFGHDYGTLYLAWGGTVERVRQFWKQDSNEYVRECARIAELLADAGVAELEFRIDGGGGYGSAAVDRLKVNKDLRSRFKHYKVYEVDFGGVPHLTKSYANRVTEMYDHVATFLRTAALINPPENLAEDLTERRYDWVTARRVEVRQLEDKDRFKLRVGRSPDDGDGCALAMADRSLFNDKVQLW